MSEDKEQKPDDRRQMTDVWFQTSAVKNIKSQISKKSQWPKFKIPNLSVEKGILMSLLESNFSSLQPPSTISAKFFGKYSLVAFMPYKVVLKMKFYINPGAPSR
jgi:hypothetical protein